MAPLYTWPSAVASPGSMTRFHCRLGDGGGMYRGGSRAASAGDEAESCAAAVTGTISCWAGPAGHSKDTLDDLARRLKRHEGGGDGHRVSTLSA